MAVDMEAVKVRTNFADIWRRILRYSQEGWESIPEEDVHLLKWYGVFLRKPTPGYFMIRVRVPGGILEQGKLSAVQLRALAEVTQRFGRDVMDLTTRQQVQLRWIKIEDVPQVLEMLNGVGLTTLQTGYDNIRNVTTCPVAGLTQDEVMDTRPLVRALNDAFVGNWKYANLPRKFNIAICGCRDNCAHAEMNDIGFTPAEKNGIRGFHVWVGGGQGSWGAQHAWPMNLFIRPEQLVETALKILDVFIEHGNRKKRNKARLKFLIEEWGIERFRGEVLNRLSFPVIETGKELTREHSHRDHIGIHPQKEPGMYYVGLNVTTGRLLLSQAFELARLAEKYGTGELRLTTGQNVIIPNVPTNKLDSFKAEPLLQELSYEPEPFQRGLIACTGNTYCPFALIETKDRMRELVAYLDDKIGSDVMREVGVFHIHASGCPNSCGNPHTGQIGLIGKKVKVDGKMEEGADVYLGAEQGLNGSFNQLWKRGVPFREMGPLLENLIRSYLSERSGGESFRQWCVRKGFIADIPVHFAPVLKES